MTPAQRLDFFARFKRFQLNRERLYAPKIYKVLKAQVQQFLDALPRGEQAAYGEITSAGMAALLRTIYNDAGITYGAKIRSDLAPLMKKARMPIGFSEQMAQLLDEYYSVFLLNNAEDITETTREVIRQIFAEAYLRGQGINDIVQQLENLNINRVRARLIARTETVAAANKGAMLAAETTGLKLNKEWIAAVDDRTRRHHLAVNGQIVGFNDYFNVGGSLMEQPGDRAGTNGRPQTPASEVCNCRCAVAPIPQEP